MAATDGNIEHRFTYHPPNDEKVLKHEVIRGKGLTLAIIISELCPPSFERDEALKKVDEAVMWANASIARNE